MSDAILDVASLSHPGMVRSHNEDSVYVDGEAGIAVLADGMGGYNAGEVASGIAVKVVSNGMLPELRSGRELSKVDIQSGLTHGALLLQHDRLGEQGHLRWRRCGGMRGDGQPSPPCSAIACRSAHRGFALLSAARRNSSN
jgi:serine/threonine protein phosphatase PrpC